MALAPLPGIRVVDLTTSFAGPYCTQILAALGADVIKIEPLLGDASRQWGPPFSHGAAAMFLAANAGKRSLALDLGRGADVVKRLASDADVFVQSMRPGLAAKYGLDAQTLRSENPRLVYCSVGAYGLTGPRKDLPGYDPLMQAAGGLISVTGEPNRPPVRLGISAIDQGTGMWAALAVLGALLERQLTGEGREVEVALYETALSFMGYHLTGYLGSGNVPRAAGTAFPSLAPYQIFDTQDGPMIIAAATDRQFKALAEVVGVPEIGDDPRFATNPDRVAHRDVLSSILTDRFTHEQREVWLARLAEAGIPAAPVQDVAEVAADEQTLALGILQEFDHHTLVAPPITAGGERPMYTRAPPARGADTAEILAEAGYSPEEIEQLRAANVVHVAAADSTAASRS